MNPATMTQLGRALGCPQEYNSSSAGRPLPAAASSSERQPRSQSDRASRATDETEDRSQKTEWRRASDSCLLTPALPDCCYFSGPLAELGPAPAPHVQMALGFTYSDQEARELAARGRADIIRFIEMKRRKPRTAEMAAARRRNRVARSAS